MKFLHIRKDVIPVSLIWLETMTLNLGLTNLTKTLLSRKRPYLYGNKASLNEKQKNDNQRSFFSGHTSTTAASWFMLAKIYQDYYPHDKLSPYIWSFSAVLPCLDCASRRASTSDLLGFCIERRFEVERRSTFLEFNFEVLSELFKEFPELGISRSWSLEELFMETLVLTVAETAVDANFLESTRVRSLLLSADLP